MIANYYRLGNDKIMGNLIRFMFKTNFRYSKTDQFFVILGILGMAEWLFIILFTVFKTLK